MTPSMFSMAYILLSTVRHFKFKAQSLQEGNRVSSCEYIGRLRPDVTSLLPYLLFTKHLHQMAYTSSWTEMTYLRAAGEAIGHHQRLRSAPADGGQQYAFRKRARHLVILFRVPESTRQPTAT